MGWRKISLVVMLAGKPLVVSRLVIPVLELESKSKSKWKWKWMASEMADARPALIPDPRRACARSPG